MKKHVILATQIIQDFKRRKIDPDFEYKVEQGIIKLWRLNQNLIPELSIGKTIITGKNAYTNTVTPQDIANDLIAENKLGSNELGEIELMSASQMGKIGGSSKSAKKSAASAENGKKGGRPKKVKEEA